MHEKQSGNYFIGSSLSTNMKHTKALQGTYQPFSQEELRPKFSVEPVDVKYAKKQLEHYKQIVDSS